ncbi:lipoprotein [Caballeronia peredens]|nr:lipoprotein [Caballeronia peredens]
MPRIVFTILCAAFALGLTACADSSATKHPPQDPPDYKGVPTDMTPPSMIDAPSQPK